MQQRIFLKKCAMQAQLYFPLFFQVFLSFSFCASGASTKDFKKYHQQFEAIKNYSFMYTNLWTSSV